MRERWLLLLSQDFLRGPDQEHVQARQLHQRHDHAVRRTQGQQIYARAFAPRAGESWPGPGKRAILMANLDSRRTHTVAFDGLKGARLWSVVHGVSGEWETPFAESTSAADTLAMQPLAVVLAFLQ